MKKLVEREQMANDKKLLNQFDDDYIIMIRLEVSDQKNRHRWKGRRAKTKAVLKPVQKSNGNNLVVCNIKILQERIHYNDEDADRKRTDG